MILLRKIYAIVRVKFLEVKLFYLGWSASGVACGADLVIAARLHSQIRRFVSAPDFVERVSNPTLRNLASTYQIEWPLTEDKITFAHRVTQGIKNTNIGELLFGR